MWVVAGGSERKQTQRPYGGKVEEETTFSETQPTPCCGGQLADRSIRAESEELNNPAMWENKDVIFIFTNGLTLPHCHINLL